jgi:2-keto-4-pentenoate hydratase/2-oxohepta-3-ene-1,7-dioic acid hydratase in catechol pathway
MLGKSLDGSAPVGPWLVTADLADGDNLKIECRVNGEVREGLSRDQKSSDIFAASAKFRATSGTAFW